MNKKEYEKPQEKQKYCRKKKFQKFDNTEGEKHKAKSPKNIRTNRIMMKM